MPRGFVNKRDRFKWDNVHEPEGEFPVQASNVVTGEDETLDEALTALDDRIDQTQEDIAAALYVTGTVTGAAGAAAEITDGAEGSKLIKCVISFVPAQPGAGDPSPVNERPLIGFTSVKVTDSNETDYDLSLGDTYYIGNVDLISGVLNVTGAVNTYNTSDGWSLGTYSIYRSLSNLKRDGVYYNNLFKAVNVTQTALQSGQCTVLSATPNNRLAVGLTEDVSDTLEHFDTFLRAHPMQFGFSYIDPIVVQLTPQEIQMLADTISYDAVCLNGTDTYDPVSLEIKYQRDFNTAIQNLLDAAAANRAVTLTKSAPEPDPEFIEEEPVKKTTRKKTTE